MSITKVSDEERRVAFERAEQMSNRKHGEFVCIGGIGGHAECYGYFPPCPYCIAAVIYGMDGMESES